MSMSWTGRCCLTYGYDQGPGKHTAIASAGVIKAPLTDSPGFGEAIIRSFLVAILAQALSVPCLSALCRSSLGHTVSLLFTGAMGPYGKSSSGSSNPFSNGKGEGKDKGTSEEPKGKGKDKGTAEEPKGKGKDKGTGKGEGKDKGTGKAAETKGQSKSWWSLYLKVKTARANAFKAEEAASAVVAALEEIESEMERLL